MKPEGHHAPGQGAHAPSASPVGSAPHSKGPGAGGAPGPRDVAPLAEREEGGRGEGDRPPAKERGAVPEAQAPTRGAPLATSQASPS